MFNQLHIIVFYLLLGGNTVKDGVGRTDLVLDGVRTENDDIGQTYNTYQNAKYQEDLGELDNLDELQRLLEKSIEDDEKVNCN